MLGSAICSLESRRTLTGAHRGFFTRRRWGMTFELGVGFNSCDTCKTPNNKIMTLWTLKPIFVSQGKPCPFFLVWYLQANGIKPTLSSQLEEQPQPLGLWATSMELIHCDRVIYFTKWTDLCMADYSHQALVQELRQIEAKARKMWGDWAIWGGEKPRNKSSEFGDETKSTKWGKCCGETLYLLNARTSRSSCMSTMPWPSNTHSTWTSSRCLEVCWAEKFQTKPPAAEAKEPVPCGILYDNPLYEACSFDTFDEDGRLVWRGCVVYYRALNVPRSWNSLHSYCIVFILPFQHAHLTVEPDRPQGSSL